MSSPTPAEVARLAGTHGSRVFAAAYRLLGNADDAEDVMQDVFLKLLRQPPPAAPRDWTAYLCTMATHRGIDLLRHRRTRGEIAVDFIDSMPAAERDGPRQTAERRQQAQLLRRMIAALPTRDATLFALRYVHELSYDQIAAQLGIGVSQVGVRLHRVRARLRRQLTPLLKERPGKVRPNEPAEL